jgi:hypothetical protein
MSEQRTRSVAADRSAPMVRVDGSPKIKKYIKKRLYNGFN